MDKVTVIQADREAAAAIIMTGEKWPGLRDKVAAELQHGLNDDYVLVQAFAKHRLATPAPDSEKLREAARECLAKVLEAEGHPLIAEDVRFKYKTNVGSAVALKAMLTFADEATRPPAQAGAEIAAITAEMRRFMPNACGDWADKIDAAMLTGKVRKVAFYHEPGHDIRPGETLPDRDRRIYQQGRHDALNDEPEAFI